MYLAYLDYMSSLNPINPVVLPRSTFFIQKMDQNRNIHTYRKEVLHWLTLKVQTGMFCLTRADMSVRVVLVIASYVRCVRAILYDDEC